MPMLTEGKKAPAFTLKDQNDEKVSLKDFSGQRVVVYFYPKALTPGCTLQAQGIRDSKKDLKKAKTTVLAISPDEPTKLAKFVDKHDLNFTLLSDPEHKIAEKYGVWGLKKFMGKEFMGIIRTTFVIDEKGKVEKVLDKFKTKTHHETLLDYLNQ